MSEAEITEELLKEWGFRWHQFERQPSKHWLLWIGEARAEGLSSYEDLGVELAPAWWKNSAGVQVGETRWHCWLRDDSAGKYHRFIHLRYLKVKADLLALLYGLTGTLFDPALVMYGSLRTPESAARIRAADERLDRRMNRARPPWYDVEKDPHLSGPLIDHVQAYEKARQ